MKRPNIVFILTDDQGYGDLGCTGNPWIQTPNMDQLKQDGVSLTNYHVGPTCAPTRAGLMTGHYANSTGVWHTIGGRCLLREDEYTLAAALAEHNYQTGIFGKWHLGDDYPYRPQDRGFQEVVIHGGGGISQTPDYWGNDYFDDYYCVNGEWKQFNGYCTDVFFKEALSFIHKCKEEPFFCYLATNAPHSPYNVEDKYADLYRGRVKENRARFYGMITNIDENIGLLRKKLKEWDLEKDTILIFMTDNGSSEDCIYDEAGNLTEGYNAGLRGVKNSEYDGGHRTPFFIYYPNGLIAGGRENNELTANIDFMPTILDLCNIPYKAEAYHGISIKKILQNPAEELENRVLVTDSQRLVNPVKWRKSAVMQGEWRLVNGKELYNLKEDRLQLLNVAYEYPEKVEYFRDEYEKWWRLVSKRFNEAIPLHIKQATLLNTHDWRGDENCMWNQGFIRKGLEETGHWEILVEEEGAYTIKLYRWPPQTGYGIRQAIHGADGGFDRTRVPKEYWFYYEGGASLDIVEAQIYLDGILLEKKPVGEKDIHALFSHNLSFGNHTLEGKFLLRNGGCIGSYYAELNKV